MIKTIFSRVVWVGRATVFTTGLTVTLALMLGVATVALAAVPGDPFRLGRINTINTLSTLVGSVSTTMLRIDNNGSGTALDLQVQPGKAPMKVNSNARVANLNADQLDGKDSSDFAAYERTVIASPVPGNPSASGTALLDALSSITDASQDNPYLLKIEPGVYDLGTSPLVMKQWVDIEGSGERATTIRRAGSSNFETAGTIVGAKNAELRFVTVENTGGAFYAMAILNEDASSLRIAHVTADAAGGSSINYGVVTLSANPEMTDVTVAATGKNTDNYGLYNENSSPTLTDVSATASGGYFNFGVINRSASPTMTSVTATASGGTNSYGVHNGDSSSPIVRDSTIRASGSLSNAVAINSVNAGTVQIDNSRLIAPTTGQTLISGGSGTITRVGASLLDGGPSGVGGSSTLTCAGVYDENYTFYANTCP